MIILEFNQVETMVVKCDQSGETFEAVAYKEHLYRPVKRFELDQKQCALKYAKQLFLDQKGKFNVLVLDEVHNWGVWQQDFSLKICEVKPPPSLVETLNLEVVVAQMRNVGGINIRDRRYNLKIYPRCFIGSEAVDWFTQTFELSRQEAVQLGQRLVNDRWIHHVADDHDFKDDYLFYRFYWDEDSLIK